MTSAVSIVIPNWNGRELLERFLPSVIAAATHYIQEYSAPVEIVIVDDGSEDKSVEWLLGAGFIEEDASGTEPPSVVAGTARSATSTSSGQQPSAQNLPGPTLRLIRNVVNRGFGPTCNRGFESARYPLAFLLNNDVEVDVHAIAPLVENFEDGAVFAAHCRVFDVESGRECGSGKLGSFSRGFIRVHRSYVAADEESGGEERKFKTTASRYSIFASGGSAMFDRRMFIEIGSFDGLLAPIYWEDVDVSYRAWKRGFSIVYEPRSVVHHRVSSTMRTVNQRKIWRMQQRNRLIYHWVNLHDPMFIASHVMWVAFLAVTAPLRFQPGFLFSILAALRRLPEIRKRRLEEKQAAKRSDREVFGVFTALEKRADVVAYDDYEELKAIDQRSDGAEVTGQMTG